MRTALSCLVLLFLVAVSAAEEIDATIELGTPVSLTLQGGDVLYGKLVARDAKSIRLDHALLGKLRIPRTAIVAIHSTAVSPLASATPIPTPRLTRGEEPPPSVVAPPPPVSAPEAIAAAAAAPPAQPTPGTEAKKPTAWKGELSAGINGSEGNSDRFSLLASALAKQATEDHRWKLSASAKQVDDNGTTSESFVRGAGRHDWLFRGSRWEAYAQTDVDHDKLKKYDARWAFSVGPGYRWIDTKTTFLLTRVGVGASREFGGNDDRFIPEGLFGLDASHALSESQRLFLNFEIFPSLDDPGEFRAFSDAGFEVDITADWPLALRLSVEDRYDSNTAPGVEGNDVDYMVSLVYKL